MDTMDEALVAQIEEQLLSGDASRLQDYARDTIEGNRHSQTTLNRRKHFLRMLRLDTEEHLHHFAILSVMTDDKIGWDSYSYIMEDDPDPIMPILAYRFLFSTEPELDVLQRWQFLVHLSAERGQVEARHFVFLERFGQDKMLTKIMSCLHKFYLVIWMFPIAIRNPNDRRLPRLRK